MRLTILTWLAISISPIKAPEAPAWPGELPPAQTQDSGTFLPAPLDKAILERLVYLDHYPELCQSSLDALDTLKSIQPAPEPSFLQDYAWPITAVAGGLVGGIVIGYKLAR